MNRGAHDADMRPGNPLQAAIALTDLGWPVFPIHEPDPSQPGGCSCRSRECGSPGKHPRVPRGLHEATRAFEILDHWWLRWPTAGIGVATGLASGIFVLDEDGRQGAESLAELPPLPETVEATTGRGSHVYLRMPDIDIRNSAGKIAPGLDIRGTGGYVIAPPSRHPSGCRYEWVRDPFDHDLADAPRWLLEAIGPKEPEAVPEPLEHSGSHGARYIKAAIDAECDELATTPEGSRNHRLNLAAFNLARFLATGDVDIAMVARRLAFAAARAGLDRREIERTLHSAFRARGAV